MTVQEVTLTEQDIHERMSALAEKVGLSSADELRTRVANGDFHGTILESKVSSLVFLLWAYPAAAAE